MATVDEHPGVNYDTEESLPSWRIDNQPCSLINNVPGIKPTFGDSVVFAPDALELSAKLGNFDTAEDTTLVGEFRWQWKKWQVNSTGHVFFHSALLRRIACRPLVPADMGDGRAVAEELRITTG